MPRTQTDDTDTCAYCDEDGEDPWEWSSTRRDVWWSMWAGWAMQHEVMMKHGGERWVVVERKARGSVSAALFTRLDSQPRALFFVSHAGTLRLAGPESGAGHWVASGSRGQHHHLLSRFHAPSILARTLRMRCVVCGPEKRVVSLAGGIRGPG
eukprot:178745-Rhodomonas_salina.1